MTLTAAGVDRLGRLIYDVKNDEEPSSRKSAKPKTIRRIPFSKRNRNHGKRH